MDFIKEKFINLFSNLWKFQDKPYNKNNKNESYTYIILNLRSMDWKLSYNHDIIYR